jgi:hypothetical protein
MERNKKYPLQRKRLPKRNALLTNQGCSGGSNRRRGEHCIAEEARIANKKAAEEKRIAEELHTLEEKATEEQDIAEERVGEEAGIESQRKHELPRRLVSQTTTIRRRGRQRS